MALETWIEIQLGDQWIRSGQVVDPRENPGPYSNEEVEVITLIDQYQAVRAVLNAQLLALKERI